MIDIPNHAPGFVYGADRTRDVCGRADEEPIVGSRKRRLAGARRIKLVQRLPARHSPHCEPSELAAGSVHNRDRKRNQVGSGGQTGANHRCYLGLTLGNFFDCVNLDRMERIARDCMHVALTAAPNPLAEPNRAAFVEEELAAHRAIAMTSDLSSSVRALTVSLSI